MRSFSCLKVSLIQQYISHVFSFSESDSTDDNSAIHFKYAIYLLNWHKLEIKCDQMFSVYFHFLNFVIRTISWHLPISVRFSTVQQADRRPASQPASPFNFNFSHICHSYTIYMFNEFNKIKLLNKFYIFKLKSMQPKKRKKTYTHLKIAEQKKNEITIKMSIYMPLMRADHSQSNRNDTWLWPWANELYVSQSHHTIHQKYKPKTAFRLCPCKNCILTRAVLLHHTTVNTHTKKRVSVCVLRCDSFASALDWVENENEIAIYWK